MSKIKTRTSVEVQSDLFEDFKMECVKRKFSLQKLVDRAIHMYLTNDEFKKSIHNHNNLDR
jgi:ribosomal protein S10